MMLKAKQTPHYWFWCSFPGAPSTLTWSSLILNLLDTPCLPCSLAFLKCHCPLASGCLYLNSWSFCFIAFDLGLPMMRFSYILESYNFKARRTFVDNRGHLIPFIWRNRTQGSQGRMQSYTAYDGEARTRPNTSTSFVSCELDYDTWK